jgi:hypothetical protein
MSDERARREPTEAVDRRLAEAFESLPAFALPAARDTVARFDDHWCGDLLRSCHGAMGGRDAPVDRETRSAVVAAAASVELLRAYCHRRWIALDWTGEPDRDTGQPDRDTGHPDLDTDRADGPPAPAEVKDVGADVLAGDYLHATAYRVLGDLPAESYRPCLDTLTDVSATLAETFDEERDGDGESPPPPAFFEGTGGALGEGAAVMGAELAGVDTDARETAGTLGRGLGVYRGITAFLDVTADRPADRSSSPDRRDGANATHDRSRGRRPSRGQSLDADVSVDRDSRAGELLASAEAQLDAARGACRSLVGAAADPGLEAMVEQFESAGE